MLRKRKTVLREARHPVFWKNTKREHIDDEDRSQIKSGQRNPSFEGASLKKYPLRFEKFHKIPQKVARKTLKIHRNS